LNVLVRSELSLVHDDRPVVDVATDPELVLQMGTADELAVHAEPRNFSGNDGAGGQDGADLVAHGGAARLLEDFPNSCKGTGIKAELGDARDVLRVDGGHVSFDAM